MPNVWTRCNTSGQCLIAAFLAAKTPRRAPVTASATSVPPEGYQCLSAPMALAVATPVVAIWPIVGAIDRRIVAVAIVGAPGPIRAVALATPAPAATAPDAAPSHSVDRGLRLADSLPLDEHLCTGR
jgi:hypothetical protein